MRWDILLPNAIPDQAGRASQAAPLCMDNEAFASFYQRSARPLWAYLARVSADPSLADDLMQEAYVRFLSAGNAPSLHDGEVAARRYLFRIASNLLRDHWRRPPAKSIEELPEDFFTASSIVAQQDSQAILGPALARMSLRERQLLWLAHAEGYEHKEIAEITGLASASIRLLLFRARHKIAKYLREPARPTLTPALPIRRQP